MPYRTADLDASPRFSDRQLAWIEGMSSEAEVNANARGVTLTKAPFGPPDEIMQVMGALGLPFCITGGITWFATHSRLSFLPLGLGALLLFVALERWLSHAKQRRLPPKIEIIVVEPRFFDRAFTDADDVERSYKYLRCATRNEPREWMFPSKLHALVPTLTDGERLRVGLITRNGTEYLAWAYPL